MCVLRGLHAETTIAYLHATHDMNGDNVSGQWDDHKNEAGSWKNLSKAS